MSLNLILLISFLSIFLFLSNKNKSNTDNFQSFNTNNSKCFSLKIELTNILDKLKRYKCK